MTFKPSTEKNRDGVKSVWAILVYERCEQLTGLLVCWTVVFAPWAFGTTQPWSIWTMNGFNYALGLLLLVKLAIRSGFNYRPETWESGPAVPLLKKSLAGLTVVILAYIFISAINARSTYDSVRMDFDYLKFREWLPHSYNRAKTWQMLADYAALAAFFWSASDWLMGKTRAEARAARAGETETGQRAGIPTRLRTLLWVLCLNGSALALEGIIQRWDGGSKLLWLVEPRINREAVAQFGPYAYRANGAQYFNLLWPVALAFWWWLRREARRARSTEGAMAQSKIFLLWPIIILLVGCPIISTSRAGAAIAIAGMVIAAGIVVSGLKHHHPGVKFGVILFFTTALATGLYIGWDQLAHRLQTTETDLVAREDIYKTAWNVVHDYPVFGTGPGSFEAVFQLYRSSTDEYWPAQLHNDWLETLITFGIVGSVVIALLFLGVIGKRFLTDSGIQADWRFAVLLWLALAGCLFHARFDFPLQVYSILHLFLLICAILFTLARRSAGRGN